MDQQLEVEKGKKLGLYEASKKIKQTRFLCARLELAYEHTVE